MILSPFKMSKTVFLNVFLQMKLPLQSGKTGKVQNYEGLYLRAKDGKGCPSL